MTDWNQVAVRGQVVRCIEAVHHLAELHRRAATATHGPEEFRTLGGTGRHDLAVGQHRRQRPHVVGGQTEAAAVEAGATTQQVADHPDGG
ncbi:hypothetical protein [Kineococcus sp. SYSU DK005]|uniref:hypothetical protein n=1 Tax=Kineococcus sp. SYSU DK005 TaxID=3383126 RepID=UPI003D7DD833